MNDSQQAIPPVQVPADDPQDQVSYADTASDTGGQSPLDALEKILEEAKAKKESSGPSEEEVAAEQKKLAEEAAFNAQKEEQKIRDQQELEIKIAELKNVEQTPQYQARVQQHQQEVEEKQQTQADNDGYQIDQLDHTKI